MKKRRKKKRERSGRKRHRNQRSMKRPEFVKEKLGESALSDLQPLFESLQDPSMFEQAREGLLQKITAKTRQVEEILDGYDPYEILASLSISELSINPETFKEPTHEGSTFVVEHVALLLLKKPYPNDVKPGLPNLEQVIALAKEINALTIYLHGVKRPTGPMSEQEKAQASLQFLATASGFSVRPPGYDHHLREDIANLFQPMQYELETELGFSFGDLLKVDDACERLHHSKLESQKQTVENFKIEIMTALEKDRAPIGLPPEFSADVVDKLRGFPPHARKNALEVLGVAWFASTMGRLSYSFSAEELASDMGIAETAAKSLLDFFSLKFESQPEDYTLFNASHPLKSQPFIEHEGQYIYPLPGTLLWAARPRIEAFLNPDAKLGPGSKAIWKRYKDHRAKYLEEKSLELLKTRLRLSETYRSLYYYPDGDKSRRCELDGLILYDRTIIFLEAKAGALTSSAKRGSPLGLKTDLKKLIREAHEQGLRAQEYFDSAENPKFLEESGNEIVLDKKRFTRSLVLATTLEPLDVFQSSISLLAKAGYTKDATLPWAISLGNLRVVCEVSEFPTQIIDYAFKRKRAIESKDILAHDELDWFAHYLSTGLYFEDREFKNADRIHLNTFEATAFDDFYNYQQGIRRTPASKPRMNIPELLRDWILELDYQHDFEGRSETVMMLLDWSGNSMEKLVQEYSRYRARTRHDKQVHDCSIASKDGGGVTFFTISGNEDEKFLKRLHSYIVIKKYQTRLQRWVGFLSNVDRPGHIHGVAFEDSPWKENEQMEALISQLPGLRTF